MFFFGKSDIGKKRSSNQDYFKTVKLAPDVVLCVVCDGMGGANGGNIASEMAVEIFSETVSEKISEKLRSGEFPNASSETEICAKPAEKASGSGALEILTDAAKAANSSVFLKSQRDSRLEGMGTTLVATLIINNMLYAVNVGDSRLYMISKDSMKQLSHDHSYVQYLVDIGRLEPEEAAVSPHKNIITRAIGISREVEVDSFCVDLRARSGICYFMLCSDGLTNYLSEDKIQNIISDNNNFDEELYSGESRPDFKAIEEELQSKAETLVNRANENGGGDNITVVILKYIPTSEKTKNTLPSDNYTLKIEAAEDFVSRVNDDIRKTTRAIKNSMKAVAKIKPENGKEPGTTANKKADGK